MSAAKYPEVTAKLIGEDGNVFVIIGAVSKALKKAGLKDAAEQWTTDAMACESYDDVLRLAMETVDVE